MGGVRTGSGSSPTALRIMSAPVTASLTPEYVSVLAVSSVPVRMHVRSTPMPAEATGTPVHTRVPPASACSAARHNGCLGFLQCAMFVWLVKHSAGSGCSVGRWPREGVCIWGGPHMIGWISGSKRVRETCRAQHDAGQDWGLTATNLSHREAARAQQGC